MPHGIKIFHKQIFLADNVAAKISVRPSEGMAEGRCGGNSAVFLQKIEVKPAALLVQSRTQQKSFLFLLEEKIGGARNIKNAEKTFLLDGERQRAAAGWLPLSGSVSRSKKVREVYNYSIKRDRKGRRWNFIKESCIIKL